MVLFTTQNCLPVRSSTLGLHPAVYLFCPREFIERFFPTGDKFPASDLAGAPKVFHFSSVMAYGHVKASSREKKSISLACVSLLRSHPPSSPLWTHLLHWSSLQPCLLTCLVTANQDSACPLYPMVSPCQGQHDLPPTKSNLLFQASFMVSFSKTFLIKLSLSPLFPPKPYHVPPVQAPGLVLGSPAPAPPYLWRCPLLYSHSSSFTLLSTSEACF